LAVTEALLGAIGVDEGRAVTVWGNGTACGQELPTPQIDLWGLLISRQIQTQTIDQPLDQGQLTGGEFVLEQVEHGLFQVGMEGQRAQHNRLTGGGGNQLFTEFGIKQGEHPTEVGALRTQDREGTELALGIKNPAMAFKYKQHFRTGGSGLENRSCREMTAFTSQVIR
jgi:hypothetical protein